jgi:Replicative DNA helicase
MTRDEAKEAVKEKLEDYLRGKGINPRKAFSCLNPQHADNNPSMSFDRKHNRVRCFSCGASYDVLDLIGIDYNLTENRDIFAKAYELYGIQIDGGERRRAEEDFMDGQKHDKTGRGKDVYTHNEEPEKDYTAYYEKCKSRIGETDYHRGLSLETLSRHWVGYEPEFKTKDYDTGEFTVWKALIIPTGKGAYTVRNTDPNASKKNRYRNRGAAQVFNFSAIQSATKPVFIVEGEIDAMSIEEAGGAAIGLGSLDNVPLLLRMLEAKKPSQPLIIALDNEADAKKQETVDAKEKQLTDGLDRLNISYYRLRPFAGYHDANEALLSDRTAFAEAIAGAENIERQAEEEEKQAYLATNTGAYLQQFIDGIAESVNTDAIPSGFRELDKVLDGGFYEGLITVGGISSLGKTSLILQIGDKVAGAGNDVLIFSLEMARAELMAKSISRHTLEIALHDGIDRRNAKTARGITDGKRHINYSRVEQDLIKTAITEYGKYAEKLYIQEGVGDIGTEQIRETVEKHIRFTGRRPLVIVDYLQVIAPYNERYSDKQNTDKAILELKRISRDCKVPVIAISSFNRNSYKAEAQFESMKESGSIEYGSDIVIGLQLKGAGRKDFNPTEEKKKNPRQVELVILKNRQGKVGDKILFDYYPMFNYFDEEGVSD